MAPISPGNKFAVQRTTVSDVESNLDVVTLRTFVAVVRVLESNPQLALKQADFNGADVILSTIKVDGYGELWFWARVACDRSVVFLEFNVKEIRPPNMDSSGRTKYPVLFGVYGDISPWGFSAILS